MCIIVFYMYKNHGAPRLRRETACGLHGTGACTTVTRAFPRFQRGARHGLAHAALASWAAYVVLVGDRAWCRGAIHGADALGDACGVGVVGDGAWCRAVHGGDALGDA
jgi:hypothetical protein